MGSTLEAVGAGLVGGPLEMVGSALAAPGHLISGGGALAGSALSALGAPETGQAVTSGAETAGEAVASAGQWVNHLGQSITPPPGYEDGIAYNAAKMVGQGATALAGFFIGDGPLVAGTIGAQAFTDAYNANIQQGVSPEMATVNAGLKALASAGMMTLPISRFAETLSTLGQRALLAGITRMAADDVFMVGANQAQQLVNNVVDRLTTRPDQPLTAGVGQPKELAEQAIAGLLPGAVAIGGHALGLSTGGRPVERPAGAGEGTPGVAAEPQPGSAQERPGEQGAALRSAPSPEGALPEAPRAAAPAVDETKVAQGIAQPQGTDEGATLVRAQDNNGQDWIGHGGVLVAEGVNPHVDQHFQDAEQHAPVASRDAEDVSTLLRVANDTVGSQIAWTGQTTDADGVDWVKGHDASGRQVELPAERYAVLAHYASPDNLFLSGKPGEPPMVTARAMQPDQPGEPPPILALAQGRVPQPEQNALAMAPTLETQDALAARAVPRARRSPGITVPDITDRPSLYREAFRDAGYDPDTIVKRPIGEQLGVLADHVENTMGFKVAVDPKMQPNKAVDNLLDLYRNGRWMSSVLGYPLKALSMNGKVSLNLEPFKPVRPYLGMYDSGTRTIHMPDRSNSFAHEWTHALDHELMTKLMLNPGARGMLTSSRARDGGLDINAAPPGNSTEAFAQLLRAIYHDQAPESARLMQLNASSDPKDAAEAQRIASGMRAKAPLPETGFVQAARGAPNSRYYSMPEELLARSGEAYMAHLVEQAGGGNEFITKGDANYLAGRARGFAEMYPQATERAAIFRAWDALHAQLLKEQAFGTGRAAQRPGRLDMLDPVHWRNVSDPNQNPTLVKTLRATVQRNQNWLQRAVEETKQNMGISGKGAKTSYTTAPQHVLDAGRGWLYANMGQLEVQLDRITQAVKDGKVDKSAIQLLKDHMGRLGFFYGQGILQKTPFENRTRQITIPYINKFEDILNHNDIPWLRMSDADADAFYRASVGRPDPGTPGNTLRATAETTALSRAAYYDLERAGVNVGFTRDENFYPVQYNEAKINADPQAAQATMTQAHGVDFEVKQRRDPGFIREAYDSLPRNALDRSVHDAMDQLAGVQNDMRREAAQPVPDQAKLAALDAEQTRLLAQVHDPIRDAYAADNGAAWRHAVNDVDWQDATGSRGPNNSHLKSRVLSPEARQVMEPYIITDPRVAWPLYYHSIGRAVAFMEHFGRNGVVLQKTLDGLLAAGVERNEVLQIKGITKSALGMTNTSNRLLGEDMSNWAHALATMSLMPRASFTSLAEPLTLALQSGDMRAAGTALGNALKQTLMQVNLIKGNERDQNLAELARYLGAVTGPLYESTIMTRDHDAYAGAPRLGRVLMKYYRRTGLTQVTNGSKIGTIKGVHEVLVSQAERILNGTRTTLFDPQADWRELGIANARQQAFAQYVKALDGVPTAQQVAATPMGQLYGEAVNRMLGRVIMDPTRADKPIRAGTPGGRFLYGLMTFNYAFQRSVINPVMARREAAIEYEQHRLGNRALGYLSANAKWGGYVAASLGAMMAAQLPITMLRQEIFDQDGAERARAENRYWDWIIGLSLARTGIGGTLDPVMQALNGLKYQHDLGSLVLGAQMNYIQQAITDMAAPLTSASPDTNTASYRSINGAYQLFGAPTAGVAMATLPGGPLASWFWSLSGQFMSSRTAGDWFATHLVGPKGQATNLTPEQIQMQRAMQQLNTGGLAGTALPTFDAAGHMIAPKQPGQQPSQGPPSGIMGLADDLTVPAFRKGASIVTRLFR